MDYLFNQLLQHLPGIIQTLFWGVVGWIWWSLKRTFVKREDLQEFKAEVSVRFSDLETAQQDKSAAQEQLRQKLDLLPTAKDFQALALSMKEMEGDIKGMNSKMDGLSHATNRLERAVDMFTEASMERPR